MVVWVEKDFPYFLTNGAPPWFPGYYTADAFPGEIFFQALNLGGLPTPLYTFESNKERQPYYPPNESKSLAGCSKTPICGVALILRRCSVHPSTSQADSPTRRRGKMSLLIRRDATLRISGALHLGILEQPEKIIFSIGC